MDDIPILLLNASYEPLDVISIPRAVGLILKDKAERVEDSGVAKVLRTVRDDFVMTNIIKLKRYVSFRRRVTWNKSAVLRRDRWTCQFVGCGVHPGMVSGAKVYQRQDFTVEHILPRSRGGENTFENTVCACFDCNQRKGNQTLEESGMRLRAVPTAPTTRTVFTFTDKLREAMEKITT